MIVLTDHPDSDAVVLATCSLCFRTTTFRAPVTKADRPKVLEWGSGPRCRVVRSVQSSKDVAPLPARHDALRDWTDRHPGGAT